MLPNILQIYSEVHYFANGENTHNIIVLKLFTHSIQLVHTWRKGRFSRKLCCVEICIGTLENINTKVYEIILSWYCMQDAIKTSKWNCFLVGNNDIYHAEYHHTYTYRDKVLWLHCRHGDLMVKVTFTFVVCTCTIAKITRIIF